MSAAREGCLCQITLQCSTSPSIDVAASGLGAHAPREETFSCRARKARDPPPDTRLTKPSFSCSLQRHTVRGSLRRSSHPLLAGTGEPQTGPYIAFDHRRQRRPNSDDTNRITDRSGARTICINRYFPRVQRSFSTRRDPSANRLLEPLVRTQRKQEKLVFTASCSHNVNCAWQTARSAKLH